MKGRRAKLLQTFQRILAQYDITPENFQTLMEMPINDACLAVRQAVETGAGPLNFLIPETWTLPLLPKALQKPKWGVQDYVSQIMVDRPFQFYLMQTLNAQSEDVFNKRVSIMGSDILERHLNRPGGTIILNSHIGPGQLAQIILARRGLAFTSLAARNFYSLLDIELGGVDVHELGRNMGVQAVALGRQVLGKQGVIHMTGDGYSGDSGAEFKFFGPTRRFASGFAYMADLTDSKVIPIFTHIDENAQVTLTVKPVIKPDKSVLDRNERIGLMVNRYVRLLKKEWRQSPAAVPSGTIRKLAGLRPIGVAEDKGAN